MLLVLLQVLVEYDSAEVDGFIELADAVEDAFPGVIVEGVEVSDKAGAFTVTVPEGPVVYDRAPGDALPDTDDLISKLSQAGVRRAG